MLIGVLPAFGCPNWVFLTLQAVDAAAVLQCRGCADPGQGAAGRRAPIDGPAGHAGEAGHSHGDPDPAAPGLAEGPAGRHNHKYGCAGILDFGFDFGDFSRIYIPPFTRPTRTVWYALRRVHAYRILIGAYDPDVVIKSRLEGAPPAGSGFEVDELHLHLEKADGLSTACPCLPGTKSHQVRKLYLWMCL